jgi:hypothetical protein
MSDYITIRKLRELKEDWDNDGSIPPTKEAIGLAEEIMATAPAAVPLSGGGVQLVWPCGAEIDITPEGTFNLE